MVRNAKFSFGHTENDFNFVAIFTCLSVPMFPDVLILLEAPYVIEDGLNEFLCIFVLWSHHDRKIQNTALIYAGIAWMLCSPLISTCLLYQQHLTISQYKRHPWMSPYNDIDVPSIQITSYWSFSPVCEIKNSMIAVDLWRTGMSQTKWMPTPQQLLSRYSIVSVVP